MPLRILLIRYTLFAILATIVNLGTQRLVFLLGTENHIFLAAMGLGTLTGLVTKYYLDKRWIFADRDTGLRQIQRQFLLYMLMGGATTAVFWTIETAFWLIWKSGLMRDLGAVIGLTIGYVIKYHLDKRFVFKPV